MSANEGSRTNGTNAGFSASTIEEVASERNGAWPNGLLCSDCGSPQFTTPGGDICDNGHGGTPGIAPDPSASKVQEVMKQVEERRRIENQAVFRLIEPIKHPPLPREPALTQPVSATAPVEAKVDLPKPEEKRPVLEQVLIATEAQLRRKARIALKSGYLPSTVYTEDQVLTIVRAGEELGLPFMSSLRAIFLIEGKIALDATVMRALVFRKIPGARIDFVECSAERCLVEMQRPGGKPNLFAFTIEDARRAGLLGKKNWKYPISMLIARASTIGIRAIFPDAILGVFGMAYELDELGDDRDSSHAQHMSDIDIEIERLRTEILTASAPMAADKRATCLDQTNKAAANYNIELLQKILSRAKEIVESVATATATATQSTATPTATPSVAKEDLADGTEVNIEGTPQEVSSVP